MSVAVIARQQVMERAGSRVTMGHDRAAQAPRRMLVAVPRPRNREFGIVPAASELIGSAPFGVEAMECGATPREPHGSRYARRNRNRTVKHSEWHRAHRKKCLGIRPAVDHTDDRTTRQRDEMLYMAGIESRPAEHTRPRFHNVDQHSRGVRETRLTEHLGVRSPFVRV